MAGGANHAKRIVIEELNNKLTAAQGIQNSSSQQLQNVAAIKARHFRFKINNTSQFRFLGMEFEYQSSGVDKENVLNGSSGILRECMQAK